MGPIPRPVPFESDIPHPDKKNQTERNVFGPHLPSSSPNPTLRNGGTKRSRWPGFSRCFFFVRSFFSREEGNQFPVVLLFPSSSSTKTDRPPPLCRFLACFVSNFVSIVIRFDILHTNTNNNKHTTTTNKQPSSSCRSRVRTIRHVPGTTGHSGQFKGIAVRAAFFPIFFHFGR